MKALILLALLLAPALFACGGSPVTGSALAGQAVCAPAAPGIRFLAYEQASSKCENAECARLAAASYAAAEAFADSYCAPRAVVEYAPSLGAGGGPSDAGADR